MSGLAVDESDIGLKAPGFACTVHMSLLRNALDVEGSIVQYIQKTPNREENKNLYCGVRIG